MPKKKNPEGTAPASKVDWSYPITFRSLVVKHPAPTHNFDRTLDVFLTCLKLFGSIWDASRGSLEVVRSNFRRTCFREFHDLFKCLGGSRMVLGGPRTVLQNINLSGKSYIFEHIFLLPTELPIGIAYCIAR